jgi:hypothetical protein
VSRSGLGTSSLLGFRGFGGRDGGGHGRSGIGRGQAAPSRLSRIRTVETDRKMLGEKDQRADIPQQVADAPII